ncbi:MAG: hypothetical protein AB8G22_18760 [Saprospiraceae bacterium]
MKNITKRCLPFFLIGSLIINGCTTEKFEQSPVETEIKDVNAALKLTELKAKSNDFCLSR